MNRTVVDLVSAKPVGRAELADLCLHFVLQRFQPCELFPPSGQPFEIRDDQCAQRGIALRCGDPGVAVHVIGHGDRNILHSFTVTRLMWSTPHAAGPDIGDAAVTRNVRGERRTGPSHQSPSRRDDAGRLTGSTGDRAGHRRKSSPEMCV